MNVLLIGGGGREHALAYKIFKSPSLKKLFISPGNTGTELLGKNIDLDNSNFEAVIEFCKGSGIDLVVIGPEQLLVEGIADALRGKGINVFGPNYKAAEIEAHKSFAKKILQKYNIPTADYFGFDYTEQEEALNHLKHRDYPCVIKADGLAAGKGVLICNNFPEASAAINEIFVKKIFGISGEKIIVEEFLKGEEASIFAITDGKNFICLPASQDHKRVGDNDTGKNTGGMGAYAPAPLITTELQKQIEKTIIEPTINALQKENRPFTGCLYAGLMITATGPKVVEFNCRFGDPETQAVLPLLDGDFLKLLYSTANGNLDKNAVKYSGGSAVCVVAASKGYPGSYEKGFPISGLDQFNNNEVIVFHAGTMRKNSHVVTNGGRVLGLTAITNQCDLKSAQKIAYEAIKKIKFKDIYYRTDIANKAFGS
ncbi:MAG TPA: phosphoribosylamine--glycine ligase [Ignavibacteriaceae bacterium]|nr:phosphoribosylamine--glycine ligase [Ignavibacteriaceae bacterium]